MARENRSRYALLGLLSLEPMSGYQIKQFIETSIRNFWNESYGQIYPILRSLVAQGWATCSSKPQSGRPDRHVYSITEAGRQALRRWLAERPESEPVRNELLLKLFFGRQADLRDSLGHVEHYRQQQQERLEAWEAVARSLRDEGTDDPDQAYGLITLSYARHITEARLRWCDETLAALRRLEEERHARDATPDPI